MSSSVLAIFDYTSGQHGTTPIGGTLWSIINGHRGVQECLLNFVLPRTCKSKFQNIDSRIKTTIMNGTKPSDPVPLWIGGKEVTTSTIFDVISPNDGNKLWSSSSVSSKEAVQAVEAAQTALNTWRKTKPAEIRKILLKAADIFEARQEELSKYMMEETGALAPFTGFNLTVTAENFRDVAGRAANILGAVGLLLRCFLVGKSLLMSLDTTNGNTWSSSIPVQGAVWSQLWYRSLEW